jgi:hypothetical protein
VGEESPGHVLGVENLKATRLGDDGTRVADLTTRLRVKGRRVEKELTLAVSPARTPTTVVSRE